MDIGIRPARPAMRPWVRRLGWMVALLVWLPLALWWGGPRYHGGPDAPQARPQPPADVRALPDWLAQQEAQVPGLRPDAAKRIVWHGEPGRRAPWAVVYLHGFTATRAETHPLAARVAQALGAHLYEARLSGHGQDGTALARATMQQWLADGVEALRIGHALGERVLVIGTSTGATLAAWLAQHPDAAGVPMARQVWISPNFGPQDKRTEWLLGPWGRQIAHIVTGGTVGTPSEDPRIEAAWTRVYPVEALLPMMALVQRVREGDWARVRTPVLVLFSPADRTVDPALTQAVVARLPPGVATLEAVTDSTDAEQHVLAGELRSPGTTERLAERIVRWAQATP
ncbi:alpha/beta hydrolase [Tepidimonas charontis]|uniref:Thermostable monoacylglycerol lipase n=1 Tax=Tepidimonas charontis TaxID=2267262 RepID=A0A554XF28_9BURK|nr:alpha/beta hydrolase [Tepidimonas charontis]TSE34442.1 Thermostable monoacylglycerol lipase [Tepidimonas charontis]